MAHGKLPVGRLHSLGERCTTFEEVGKESAHIAVSSYLGSLDEH